MKIISLVTMGCAAALTLTGCPDYEAIKVERKSSAQSNLFTTLAPDTALGKIYKPSHCTGENSDGPSDPYVTCIAIKRADDSLLEMECPFESFNQANCIVKSQKLKVTERELY